MSEQTDNFIKKHVPAVFIRLIKSIRHFVKLQLTKQNIIVLLKQKRDIFLEIGSGGKKGVHGWTTLDLAPGCDIYWDLSKGLPFPDCRIKKIYSSHLFEHFSFEEAEKLFEECRRVLIPGGYFSICVPNAKLFVDAYYQFDLQTDATKLIAYKQGFNNISKLDYINYIAYMGGHHKYMFDEESLVNRLKLKGFKNVQLRKFDPETDLQVRDFESIYAIGQK